MGEGGKLHLIHHGWDLCRAASQKSLSRDSEDARNHYHIGKHINYTENH